MISRTCRQRICFASAGSLPWGGIVAFLLIWLPVGLLAQSVTATLDRPEVPAGQTVTLTLSFEGISPGRTPQLPNIDGLTFQGASQSSQMNIVNNQISRKINFSYQFRANRPGQVVIPPLEFVAGSTTLQTKPLLLKVLEPGATPSGDDELNKQAYLQLIVPKKEVYLGESFPLEIHLYWINGRDITTPQLKADGFSLSENPQNSQRRTPQGYNLVIFRYAATAARAGRLSLGPAQCDMTLLVPINNRGGQDPFSNFDPFGFFGTRARRMPVTLNSEEVAMNVLPLPPDNVPEGFNGAVGQFAMEVTAGPTNLAVGDPITVVTRISGQGLLDNVNLPAQPQWRDFQTYPPSSSVESNDPLGLSGTKRFEQVVIAQNHEITSLPPLRFSFFDPNQKAYRSLQGPAFPLSVRHASQAPTPLPILTNLTEQAPPPMDDILHIKARPDGIFAYQTPLLYRPWFLALQSLPLLAWLSLLIMRKRQESLASNPRLRRQRQVRLHVQKGLESLHRLAAAQDSDEFFATLFRLLQEQIGERLDMPASAITESVIDERLAKHGLSAESVQALHALFQTCNQARYAPQKSGRELAEFIPQIEASMRDIQGLKI